MRQYGDFPSDIDSRKATIQQLYPGCGCIIQTTIIREEFPDYTKQPDGTYLGLDPSGKCARHLEMEEPVSHRSGAFTQPQEAPYDMKRAVELGVQLLDERDPGWLDRTNPDTLDMAFHGLCLLSQLYGAFAEGIEQLDLGDLFGEEVQDWMGWEYGFTLPPISLGEISVLSADYARLTEAWRTAIAHQHEIKQHEEDSMTPLQWLLARSKTIEDFIEQYFLVKCLLVLVEEILLLLLLGWFLMTAPQHAPTDKWVFKWDSQIALYLAIFGLILYGALCLAMWYARRILEPEEVEVE